MIHVNTNEFPSVTLVPNTFIDELLPKANGDFVKVYIYLLRNAGSEGKDLSVGSIADALDYTEADILRALRYWEKAGVLSMGETTQSPKPVKPAVEAKTAPIPDQTLTVAIPKAHTFSSQELENFKEKEGVDELIFATQTYLSKPLSYSDLETLLYWYEDLSMPVDLIEHLIESCLASNHQSFHYMNAVAQNWYSEGIHTVEQAKTKAEVHNMAYYTVMNSLGITGRKLVADEIGYVTKWSQEYAFSLDIIKEACNRTIAQISSPSFKYVDTILSDWYAAGVKHLNDIEPLDKAHQSSSKAKASNEKFGFTSRSDSYDDELMKKLLLSSGE
ncbi:MAG: DnaD domain protein [Lachnospiraceae bacterium]|nr:DnaD domain protein [Lachnospiraceae bacterium]